MVRKYENKKKPPARKTTRTKQGKKSSSHSSSRITSSSGSELDYTLPEGNHLDSFDRFRCDDERELREKKLLKKNVRASFNRDSSIEVDSDDTEASVSMSSSSVMVIAEDDENGDQEGDENTNPAGQDEKEKSLSDSITSQNSFLYSFDTRIKRREKKFANYVPPPPPPRSAFINIKPKRGVKIVRLNIEDYMKKKPMNDTVMAVKAPPNMNAAQSTPDPRFGNISHIRHMPFDLGDETSTNEPVTKVADQPKKNLVGTPVASFIRPSTVSVRRRPRLSFLRKHLTFNHTQAQKTVENIVDDASVMNIVSENECSSIADLHENAENEEKSKTAVDDTFESNVNSNCETRSRLNTESQTFSTFNQTEDNHEKTEQSPSMDSFQVSHQNSNKTVPTNDSSIWIDISVDKPSMMMRSQQVNNSSIAAPSTSQSAISIRSTIDEESMSTVEQSQRVDETVPKSLITRRNTKSTAELPNLSVRRSIEDKSVEKSRRTDEIVPSTVVTRRKTRSSAKQPKLSVRLSVDEVEESHRVSEALPATVATRRKTRSSTKQSKLNAQSTVDEESVGEKEPSPRADEAVTSVTRRTTRSSANRPKLSMRPKVGFDAGNSIHELSAISHPDEPSQKLIMKSGKWRRTIFESRKNKITQSPNRASDRKSSLMGRQSNVRPTSQANVLRRKSIFIRDMPDRKTINGHQHLKTHTTLTVLDESDVESICSADFSPKPTSINVLSKLRSSRLQPSAESVDLDCYQKSTYELNTGSQLSLCDSSSVESVVNEIEKSTASLHLGFNHDGLKLQLLRRCGQSDVLPFDEIYSASILKKCRKIGEGVFGEVFLNETSARNSYVLKIIPIEGAEEINGAQQKRFDEILQEVIISQELSALRHSDINCSSGFVEVLNVRLVEGCYPAHLLDLWNDFDTRQGSENDSPDVFGDDQLYVVFELANCGSDLEAHVFKNAEQSFSAFKQVAISLAVAEAQFEFEHRDLHWGNVLVAPTTETSLTFNLNGKSIEIRTHGIKATIIDYTLSRLVYKNCCLFQDLAADPELFDATGDYQYDIYRLMRTQTNNYWEVFEPYTNVLWLHYTIDKMVVGVNYTAKRGVKHRQFIDKMIALRDELLDYRSATDYIEATN